MNWYIQLCILTVYMYVGHKVVCKKKVEQKCFFFIILQMFWNVSYQVVDLTSCCKVHLNQDVSYTTCLSFMFSLYILHVTVFSILSVL